MVSENTAKKELGYSGFPALWPFQTGYYKHIEWFKNT